MVALAGLTVMDVKAGGGVTVREAVLLVKASKEPDIPADPADIPVAIPEVSMDAAAESLDQATLAVISATLLSS